MWTEDIIKGLTLFRETYPYTLVDKLSIGASGETIYIYGTDFRMYIYFVKKNVIEEY